MKELVARAVAARAKDGDLIGLGSGSTAELAICELGKRVCAEGLKLFGIATSHRVAMLASEHGITVLSPFSPFRPAWGFDGADEVDADFRIIKGRGGAMLNEKIVASLVRYYIVIVTENKLVDCLGSSHPVPVEVIPSAYDFVREELLRLGATKVELREGSGKDGPVVTEHGNFVLDAMFLEIGRDYEARIKQIVGVVESGLFFGYADEILVSGADGVTSRRLIDGQLRTFQVEI